MGNLKIVRDLMLEVAELNRLKKFLIEDGYGLDFKNKNEKFGIVYNEYIDPNFNFFKCSNSGIANTVFVNRGLAYDRDRNVLASLGKNILVPFLNKAYWLKIRYKYNNIEKGTVSIGGTSGGMMTGIETEFSSVLRGQPNFPSKIKFLNSINYTLEYEIGEVVNDNLCTVQGSFPVFEQNLQYQIVGTFSPIVNLDETEKYPFEYDDFDYEFVEESGTNLMPEYNEGYEFFIARVIDNGLGITIEDKRNEFINKTRTESLLEHLPVKKNPLIAIEKIDRIQVREKQFYVINVGWGYRILSEARDVNSNKVIITSGTGGRYKTNSSFTNGDFDGWRCYYENGKYSRVLLSVKNNNTIELFVDCLVSNSQAVMVCPDCEEVEIFLHFKIDASTVYKKIPFRFLSFTINPQISVSQDEIFSNYEKIDLSHRFKTFLSVSAEDNINIGTYNITNVGEVTTAQAILSLSSLGVGGTSSNAWRGIDPYCIMKQLTPNTIYYKIVQRNIFTDPTSYSPNSSNPQSSVDITRCDLYAEFYSDQSRTSPLSINIFNLPIILKKTREEVRTIYSGGSSVETKSVFDSSLVYKVNVVSSDEVLLAEDVVVSNYQYYHPTQLQYDRDEVSRELNSFTTFPGILLVPNRNGEKGFTNLEEYNLETDLPTGDQKPNIITDENYIPPVNDDINCGAIIPSFIVRYLYDLKIDTVKFVGAINSTPLYAPTVLSTENADYSYMMPQYDDGEEVIISVKANTLSPGNNSGKVHVRVEWYTPGTTALNYSDYTVNVNVETQLPIAFKNIYRVSISNS